MATKETKTYVIKYMFKSKAGPDEVDEFAADLLEEAQEHRVPGEEVTLVSVKELNEEETG